jgi:HPt (histidine-containing phosphotransfer) domain-containing protein
MVGRTKFEAVDFDYLETYADGDVTVVEEVLSLFRDQGALWLGVLDPDGPRQGWREAVHSLKGTALGIGAIGLAKACSRAEAGLRDAHADNSLALGQVRLELEAALADVAAYQQALKA